MKQDMKYPYLFFKDYYLNASLFIFYSSSIYLHITLEKHLNE